MSEVQNYQKMDGLNDQMGQDNVLTPNEDQEEVFSSQNNLVHAQGP